MNTIDRRAFWVLVVMVATTALGGCDAGAPQSEAQTAQRSVSAAAAPQVTRAPEVPGEGAQAGAFELSAGGASSGASVSPAGLPDFETLVEAVGGAVVNVTVIGRSGLADTADGPEDDPLYDFFRRFGIPRPEQEEPRGRERGMGSGFIVSPDGYILTNAHVVGNASEVTVKLTDRREFSAKVIGADARSDVAVLKIDADRLPVAKLGDASRLRPGQWVLAIGAPFGFENSVTAGVVSGTARSLPGSDYVPFIQSDVAVNPGNSGGPLFNLAGEVVGINSQIYSRSGGYMGLSFAIPIDVARSVEEQIIRTGRVERGRIGISVQDMNAQLADSFGLDRATGALVSSVEGGGPGEKAGLKPGDVILRVNGERIERSSQLPTRIAALKPGTTATLAVWRERTSLELKVRVGEVKEVVARPRSSGRGAEESPGLGLTVRPLAPEERDAMTTEGTLVVTEVSGRAAIAGVERGDLILAVNGRTVRTMSELREAIKTSRRVTALLIQRDGAQVFIPVPIEQ